MSLGTVAGVVHVPFAVRPPYGSPYPEGMAFSQVDAADDASVGIHTFSIVADGGFLYRLEILTLARGSINVEVVHLITNHDWATQATPFGATAFQLNWAMAQSTLGAEGGGGFQIYVPANGIAAQSPPDSIPRIARFPMGATKKVALQQLMFVTVEDNVDGVTNDLAIVMAYWPISAMYRPGFLQSFWESPVVASPLPQGPAG